MPNFDVNEIKKYVQKCQKDAYKRGINEVRLNNIMTDATIFFFDKNQDGKVTREEFNNASKEEYERYIEQMAQYNETQEKKGKIFSYDELEPFFDDGILTSSDLEYIPIRYINREKTYPENKNLKSQANMTEDDYKNESKEYGINVNTFKNAFNSVRVERDELDENSNIIDWHIGTFSQGTLKNCTVLARIENLSDDELKEIYTEKQDENGNKYYEVNFPSDKGKHPVKITEYELNNRVIKHKGKDISGFSTGDLDVLLLEMAYIKRYGTTFEYDGTQSKDVMNKFSTKKDVKDYYDITEDLLSNDKAKSIGLKSPIDIANLRNGSTDTITLGENLNVKIINKDEKLYLKLPDGTEIHFNHAYAVKSYDKEEKTVTIHNPHDTSTDITLPFEIMKLFRLVE